MSSSVGYNPDDPLQAGFLAALAQGETGGSSIASTEGVGGSNLASIIEGGSVDQYGFPEWTGEGNSHAAGTYQFQPGTWDSVAAQLGLSSFTEANQDEAAWTLAQQNDPNLYSQLQSGDYTDIQSALKSIWPSVTGDGANPQGLASALSGDETTASNLSAANTAANNASTAANPQGAAASNASSSSGFSWTNPIGYALIAVGAVIIFVALWQLLSSTGMVPSPGQTAKAAAAAF